MRVPVAFAYYLQPIGDNTMNKSVWYGTAIGAMLGLAAVAYATFPARAADLSGGDCCQDLEVRVAELEATTARHGNKKVKLTISGVVDYAILHSSFSGGAKFPDGSTSNTQIIQNPNDGASLTIAASGKVAKDWTVGAVMELTIQEEEKDAIESKATYVFVDTKLLKASLGHLGSATRGLEQATIVDTTMVAPLLDVSSLAPVTGFGGAVFDQNRMNLVRLDLTPVAGLTLSASYTPHTDETFPFGDSTSLDLAGRYVNMIGKDLLVSGNVGYRNMAAGSVNIATWLASAGVKHLPSGLFVQGGFASGFSPLLFTNDLRGWHVQAGVETPMFGPGIGSTTIYGEYVSGSSGAPHLYGAGIVQALDSVGTSIYAGYRHIDPDAGGTTIDQVLGGAVVKF